METQPLINHSSKSNKQFKFVWGTLFGISIYFWDLIVEFFIQPSQRYIFVFIPSVIILIFFLFSSIQQTNNSSLKLIFSDRLNILCLASLGFGIMLNFARSDTYAVLQTGLFWLSILAYKLFASKFPVYGYTFLFVLILLIIPYALTSNNPLELQSLIPSEANQWKAFVISTHFSSVLGGIILLLGVLKFFENERSLIDIGMVFIGAFLVFFAQSRTALLAANTSLFLGLFINRTSKKKSIFVVSIIYIIYLSSNSYHSTKYWFAR